MPSKQKQKKNRKRPFLLIQQQQQRQKKNFQDTEEKEIEDGLASTSASTTSLSNLHNTNDDESSSSGSANGNPQADQSPSSFRRHHHPYRNLRDDLYTTSATLRCALGNLNNGIQQQQQQACIACAYKICTFDTALDTKFTTVVPNIRPELCPRSSSNTANSPAKTNQTKDSCHHYGYQPGMRILTVGDGDFTFSLALARMLTASRASPSGTQPTTTLIATSYESLETLERVYGKTQIHETIQEMKQLLKEYNKCQVYFQVDATNLQDTLPSHHHHRQNKSFHRIVWNFPCTAIGDGQDGQNQQMEQNKQLIRSFVQQSTQYLVEGGEIHFLHKTKPPYDQWKLQDLVVNTNTTNTTNTTNNNHNNLINYKGRIVFDKCLLPPYTPRKALDKKSFPCHDACLYVFGVRSTSSGGANDDSNKNSSSSRIILETIPSMNHSNDNDDDGSSSSILPVTRELIDGIRDLHLRCGSYNDRRKKQQQQKPRRGQKQQPMHNNKNWDSSAGNKSNNHNRKRKKRYKTS